MVVVVGRTVVLVPVTGPTPWSIESSVAPSTFQESTLDSPPAIAAGAAVKDTMVGRPEAPTVRTSAVVVVPVAFAAVTV